VCLPTSYLNNVKYWSIHHLCNVLYFFEVGFNPSISMFYDHEHSLNTRLFANSDINISGFPVFFDTWYPIVLFSNWIHKVGVSLNTTVCPLLFLICPERKFANFQLVTENVQNFKHSKNVLTPFDSVVSWRIN